MTAVTGGGFVGCGIQDGDAWLVRFDPCGFVVWENKYPVGLVSEFRRVIETAALNFCAVGWTVDRYDDVDLYAICVEPNNGGVIWQDSYSGGPVYDREDRGFDLVEVDESLILAGFTASSADQNDTDKDLWVLRVSESDGSFLGGLRTGGPGDEEAYTVFRNPATMFGFVVAGYSDSWQNGALGKDMYVVWLPDLTLLLPTQQVLYGGVLDEVAHDGLTLFPDGNLLLVGEESSFAMGAFGTNVWALKIRESDGQILWQESYHCPRNVYESAFSVMQSTHDGALVMAGRIGPDLLLQRPSTDMLLLKANPNDGSLVWDKYYDSYWGRDYNDHGYGVAEAEDGDIYFGGEISLIPAPNWDWWTLRLDPTGDVDPTQAEWYCWFHHPGLVAWDTEERWQPIAIEWAGYPALVEPHTSGQPTSLTPLTLCVTPPCAP